MWWLPQLDEWPLWFVLTGACVLLVLLAHLGNRRRQLTATQVTDDGDEVGCGTCGYDLRGLPGDICPKCGSNLNDVGRFAMRFKRWQRLPGALRLLAWTLACTFVLGLCVVNYEATVGPWVDHRTNLRETYLTHTDANGNATRFMLRIRRETVTYSRQSSRAVGDEQHGSQLTVELHEVSPARAKLVAKQPARVDQFGRNFLVPAGMAWPEPDRPPLLPVTGPEEQIDAIDWTTLVRDHTNQSLPDPRSDSLAYWLSYQSASMVKRPDMAHPSMKYLSDPEAYWSPLNVTVAWSSYNGPGRSPMVVMLVLAGLTWLLGIWPVMKSRPRRSIGRNPRVEASPAVLASAGAG